MSDTSASQRTFLRRRILALRSQLTTKERAHLENQLVKRLFTLPALQEYNTFFVYCNYQTEVSTQALIDRLLLMGKTVCVPLVEPKNSAMEAVVLTDPKKELIPGYRGIPEPAPSLIPERILPPGRIEVAFIPGSVFDERGNRLGYGGGFYDRFLTHRAPQALRMGLAFSCQVIDRIPQQAHDVPMDMVITEKKILSWPRGNLA